MKFLPHACFALCLFFTASTACFSQEITAKDIEAARQQFRIPADAFTVTTNSAQPSGPIANAFDGDPKTTWHSRWRDPGKYPYFVDVTFSQDETLARIDYLPREDGWNGTIERYALWIKTAADGEWEKLSEGRLPGAAGLQTIPLADVKCRAIRLEVLQGVGGFGSAAEFVFYRPDPEVGKVAAMFARTNFPDVTAKEKKEKLAGELNQFKKSTDRPEILAEITLAEAVLNAPDTLAMKEVQAVQKPAPAVEVEWRKGGMPWSYLQPTGRCVLENQPFAVFIRTEDVAPGLVIGDFRTYQWGAQTRVPLNPGWNFFIAPTAGILYLDNPHEAPEQKSAPTAVFVGATAFPFYEYGKTTPEQWAAMLEAENPYGMAEIMTGTCLITASAGNAKKHVDDPQALCESYNHLMDTYAKLMGWDENAAPPHRRPTNLQHLLEVDHMYMYATSYRTAYQFNSMKPVLNNRTFRNDGWGPWHEIGHTHQVPGYKFHNTTEVTVNIYSLEMQTSLGQKARIDTPGYRRQLKAYFEQPERDYHKMEDVFVKLCMFWQLRMAFGDDFYPALHRTYRETELPTKTDVEKVQTFIRISSKVAGYDLSPFYDAWGLPPTDETRAEIGKLETLETPIWENMEFSVVKPAGTLGIKK